MTGDDSDQFITFRHWQAVHLAVEHELQRVIHRRFAGYGEWLRIHDFADAHSFFVVMELNRNGDEIKHITAGD